MVVYGHYVSARHDAHTRFNVFLAEVLDQIILGLVQVDVRNLYFHIILRHPCLRFCDKLLNFEVSASGSAYFVIHH